MSHFSHASTGISHSQSHAHFHFHFEPHATTYSSVNAFSLAQAARLAYRNNQDSPVEVEGKATQLEIGIESQVRQGWKFPNYHFFQHDREDTQGFIMGNHEIIVLAFRGTSSVLDWITDLDVQWKKVHQGNVHRGFWQAIDVVWAEIEQKLCEFRDNQQAVFVTGHSLGAALATLATARLLEDPTKRAWVNGLYTFGSPRVGDTAFAAWYDRLFRDRTFRFVNHCDVVTQVALKKSFPYQYEYDHVGLIKYFDSNGCLSDQILSWKYFKATFGLQVRLQMVWQGIKTQLQRSIAAFDRQGQSSQSGDGLLSQGLSSDDDVQVSWKLLVKYLLTEINDHNIENYLQCIERSIQANAIAPAPPQPMMGELQNVSV